MFVLFRASDVVMAGDVLDTTRFPVIDLANGGSIQGEITALNHLIDLAIPPIPFIYKGVGTYVIPGHGRVCEQQEVVDYRDMVVVVRDVVADLIKQGKSLEEIKQARPALPYERRYGATSGPWTTDMFIEAIYKSLDGEEIDMNRFLVLLTFAALAWGQAPAGGRGASPPSAKAAAPIDLTGYWVSVVTEDWRFRMVLPTPGDYQGVPMTAGSPENRGYVGSGQRGSRGGALQGVSARLRFCVFPGGCTSHGRTIRRCKLDADAGKQTRIFHFADGSRRPVRPHLAG